MKKKYKNRIIIAIIILLLLLLLTRCEKVEPISENISVSSSSSSTSSGGGGGSTTIVSEPEPEWSFFDISTWSFPSFDIPSLPSIPSFTFPTNDEPEQDLISTDRIVDSTRPECSRDSDCSKCSNAAYDKCVEGKCECIAPTILTCDDTDVGTIRYTDGLNYKTFGTCVDNSGTYQANDFCSTDLSLTEAYCTTDNKCAYKTVDCSTEYGRDYFCLNGVCGTWV